jgi:hypothetical protein
MVRRSFRDRFFSPRVAAAMTSPSSLVAAATVGVVGFLVTPWLAVPAALLGWAARVAIALPRKRSPRIDPFAVGEPWRNYVQAALKARARAAEAAASARTGPLRERLLEITGRIDTAVEDVWSISQRGQTLSHARRDLDPAAVRRRVDRAEPGSPATPALQAQLASVERLDRVIDEADTRLRLLQARLDEAAARTIELAVRADDDAIGALGADVDEVVSEMEALRQALDETEGGGATAPGTAAG